MIYQSVMLLSIREYLGRGDGKDAWRHIGYAVGIKDQDKAIDYQTEEVYTLIERDNEGRINAKGKKIIEGNVYAIESLHYKKEDKYYFDKHKVYDDKDIKKIIKNSTVLSSEYKSIKSKRLIK